MSERRHTRLILDLPELRRAHRLLRIGQERAVEHGRVAALEYSCFHYENEEFAVGFCREACRAGGRVGDGSACNSCFGG